MGERGVIATTKKDLALYLHWNGDIAFVKGLLLFTRVQGARNPVEDGSGWCRLAQHYNNLVGSGNADAEIGLYEDLCLSAEWNNGTYIIDKNWDVVERIKGPWDDEEPSFDEVMEIVYSLDDAAPDDDHLPRYLYDDAYCGYHPEITYEKMAQDRAWNRMHPHYS